VTAIFTFEQVKEIVDVVDSETPVILSIFADRIADTGVDPVPLMKKIVSYSKNKSNIEILWASTREALNIFQANECGCQIITVPTDILEKMKYLGKDLNQFSKETVLTFYNDAKSAKYKIT
jgi:transaldolase